MFLLYNITVQNSLMIFLARANVAVKTKYEIGHFTFENLFHDSLRSQANILKESKQLRKTIIQRKKTRVPGKTEKSHC